MIRTCYVCGKKFRSEKLKRVIVTTEDGDQYPISEICYAADDEPRYLCNRCIYPFIMGAVIHSKFDGKNAIGAEQEEKPGEF